MQVKYTGSADIRVLAAADLQKADVLGFSKTNFNRGQTVEVSDEVGQALITNDIFGGEFAEVMPAPAPEPQPEPVRIKKQSA